MNRCIHVCPLEAVGSLVKTTDASHVISLMGPDADVHRPHGISASNYLDLRFNDISSPMPGLIMPGESHVAVLLKFIDLWVDGSPGALLIHCWFGISRSPAAAFIASCHLQPQRSEADIADQLRHNSPTATPNPRLVQLADDMLQRNGRMISAIAKIGRGQETGSGSPFFIELDQMAGEKT